MINREVFEKWFKKNHAELDIYDIEGQFGEAGWVAAKKEVINILNSLHTAPNTRISLNEVIALVKEKI